MLTYVHFWSCEIRVEAKVGKENRLDYFYLAVSMFTLESGGAME